MTWELLVPLIARYGPEWVAGLLDIIRDHPKPDSEALQKVLALSQKPLDQYLREAAERALAAKQQ